MTADPSPFDAIVIGGGPAGLSAALALGRARRRVLVAAAGPPGNAPAEAAHNIFTRDGTPPTELLRIAREQLRPYDVSFLDAWAEDASIDDDGFTVTFDGGQTGGARGLILATGVRDLLPEIPGLSALWGHSVFHCPYCHGWEVAGRPLGIYTAGLDAARTLHLCRLIRGWSEDVILFTDGRSKLSDDERRMVERNGIAIRDERVEALEAAGRDLHAVLLAGGERVPRGGLLISPEQALRSDLPIRLGCKLTPDGRVESGVGGRTAVPGVFVAGDIAPGMQAVATAISSGMLAGAMLNHELLERDFLR